MLCPNRDHNLEKALFYNVEVDYCPECLGVWFDKNELQWARDSKDEQLNWVDVDLWRDKGKFKTHRINKRCPVCRIPFFEISYDSKASVKVDFCKHCQGVWLDRGEFKQIMVYLKKKADYEILHRYTKNLAVQLWEVFAGPEKFREELSDFFMLLKLFNYKFVVQHPYLNSMIENSQK
ncbi:MAG: hypothetical protein A3A98_00755 [Candidatus Staskawiczbacteria bacterium RIFCSPLOWO2_01_FULL_40_39]|uniref:Transcription factor zinc-finger domain-containing protein n=1 Tax=Candidatus Staskawiczbacteria bacterium RIFCSPHIGHO2_01_FULL_39_25 TaxID=1802202 RepID=A0A1G2HMP9_9BACT|nr:MAG: hypothetical protein A2730_00755 [Candidatus Staskawiczbacteria bacterium RIFCSPHIGHO2_01_FULL_39_25]OGZ73262.1 MAG: hypothetical protein A3A98_00755 [Candidatus Staskawiczbacteria bacterium RIFCSPLOWO2_01_FULL_40_39]OGZ74749.1 MAG: hypothetical protein A3I87_00635 [Candidatus Staskawiczbacteria bacterium RIFCSPLOWO2_02_FULL_39_8]